MSPEAQAVVSRVGGNTIPPASIATSAQAPSVIPHGMLLPHPDAGPEPAPISMGDSNQIISMPKPVPQLVTGPNRGQAMMSTGQQVHQGTLLGDEAEGSRLRDEGSGISQISHKIQNTGFGQAHPFLGKLLGGIAEGLAGTGDIALKVGGGGMGQLAEQMIPGTFGHHDLLVHQNARDVAADTENAQRQAQAASENATAQHTAAETPEVAPNAESLRGYQSAETAHLGAETANLQHPAPQLEVHDTENGPILFNKSTGVAQHVTVDGQPVGPKLKLKESQPIMGPDNKPHTYMLDEKGNKVVDLGVHYERPISISASAGEKNLWSVPQPDGSKKVVSIKPGMTIPQGAVSLSAQSIENVGKPTADEQRRADLAENLKENFGQLREIMARRPELFGPISGRLAEIRQHLGSDDPDLAALLTLEHQIGMAQVSAHGMRSAQGVQSAADSIMNNLHNGVKGLSGALDAAERSVSTFTADANKGHMSPSSQQPIPQEPQRPPNVPSGYHFDANGPKGRGWYK